MENKRVPAISARCCYSPEADEGDAGSRSAVAHRNDSRLFRARIPAIRSTRPAGFGNAGLTNYESARCSYASSG